MSHTYDGSDVTDAQVTEWRTVVAILRVIEVANALGYLVTLDEPRPADTNPEAEGAIDYTTRRIWVDPAAHPTHRLLILLHEVGHAVAADRMGYGVRHNRTTAELDAFSTGEPRAFVYGYGVARLLGLVGPGGVTRNLWRLFHGHPPGRG